METTQTVREKLARRAERRLEDSADVLEQFRQRFEADPLAALQWNTEPVVAARVLAELADFVQKAVRSEREDVEVFKTLEKFFGQMQERTFSMARSSSTSTNAVANEIARVRLVTLAEAVDFGGWLFETTALAKQALEEVAA